MRRLLTIRLLAAIASLLIFNSVTAQDVSLTVQTGHSATINKLCFSPDGSLLASAGSDNNVVLWDITSGRQLLVLTGHTRVVNDIAFHPSTSVIASASDDGKVILWDYRKGEKTTEYSFGSEVKSIAFSPDGNNIALAGKTISIIKLDNGTASKLSHVAKVAFTTITYSKDGKFLAFGGRKEKSIKLVRVSDSMVIDKFHLNTNQIVFSPDGTWLVGAGVKGKLRKWNVKNPGIFNTLGITAERIWQSYYCAAISDRYFVAGNKNNLISVFAIDNGKKIHVLNAHAKDVKALAISPDQKIMVSAGQEKQIIFWDLAKGEIIKTMQGSTDKVNAIEFVDAGKSLILGYADGSFRYWQLQPGGQMISNKVVINGLKNKFGWDFTVTDIEEVKGSQVKLIGYRIKSYKKSDDLVKGKRVIINWDINENNFKLNEKNTVKGLVPASLLNPKNLETESNAGINANITENQNIRVTEKGQVLFDQPAGHTDRVTAIKINEENNYLATAGMDGLVKLWDLKTGKLLTNQLATKESDYIFITPDNYYFSTKGALENIGFRIGSTAFSFEQFDLKYNRPDIILRALHYEDTTVAYAYEQAYKKRVQKSGVPVESIGTFDDIPAVQGNLTQGTLTSEQKSFTFKVHGEKAKTALKKLYVFVNGVPAYPKGIDIEPNLFDKDVTLELSNGINTVMYYAVNEKGITSLKRTFQVTYQGKETKPVLYLVTIGASKYKQNSFDLRYAAKDAQDIEALFRNSNNFSNVKKMSLLNENVTLETIRGLKNFLGEAKVDDMVIISYAGHGVLDHKLDYYLSTHDMDFGDPGSRGIAFGEIEELLLHAKSRNKIVMIDACHSGEIDKEEVELTAATNSSNEGNITFRNVGNNIVNKSGGPGLKTSFELSKALFADVDATHGAVVISSAGGGEYAIEGKEWNNGIFTYCFINGIKSGKSDLDKDGKISVGEMQRYLSIEVPKMTKGQQTPTSRDENLSNDFYIW